MLSRELFRSPPKSFRGVPFWSLNDLLDAAEAARQIGVLDEAGFGGVFFHAREGLVTPFLSEEWFKVFEAVVEEAGRRGMSVWIYDEDRWPSGFAGGYVPALGDRYRYKSLVMIADTKSFNGFDTVAIYRCTTDGLWIPQMCERISRPEADSSYLYLTFVRFVAPVGDVWYSGFSYVDLLDKETVGKFLEIAYKPYVDRFAKYIGCVVPGVFTDEPNIYQFKIPPSRRILTVPPRGGRFPVFALPWTDGFPEYFEEINGYSILDRLPELFFDIGSYTKTRYDYWRTVTLLFVESFSKQVFEWCERRGLKFTGHYLAEDTLVSQLVVGAAMPHYEYMHVPGIDHLGYQVWKSLLTVKQVASVANQLGKERVLCETYGVLGNYPTFEDRKWIGDFLYALGVNLLNHHLVPYSMKGRRKADYGLNLHWSQPWWRYNRLIEDYFARLSYLLSQGSRIVDVLIIHPISSVWSTYTPINESRARELDNIFLDLLRRMVGMHIDFELGDEMIMARHGRVEEGGVFVGKARYRIIVLPPSINIASSTLSLLRRFIDLGGTVVALEPTPKLVDGSENPELIKVLSSIRVVESFDDLLDILRTVDRDVVVESDDADGSVLVHCRAVGDERIVFAANVSRGKSYSVRIGVKGRYSVEEWDPFSGDVHQGFGAVSDGRTWIEMVLKPVESRVLVLRPGEPVVKQEVRVRKVGEINLDGQWSVSRRDLNTLVMDYARVSIEGGEWSDLQPLPKVREAVVSRGFGTRYKLRFEFTVESMPKGSVYLVIENPSMYRAARVNGQTIDLLRDVGEWIDWNFRRYRVDEMIRGGLNHIELEGVVGLEPEIEPVYILGEFGVKEGANGVSSITREIHTVLFNGELDLSRHGYTFYAGEIELSKRIYVELKDYDTALLAIDGLSAALAVVYVNGAEVGKLIHTSAGIDVTKHFRSGENEIRILLVSTLRNVLGPLHKEDPPWIGPETFYTVDGAWRDEYILRPLGLKSARIELYKKV
ncbi:MAG: glycosyl hydrolase [Ignisphaera sp.]|nr:glycosyl hydrolase [Ignisphaera sp.]MDW8084715.1 glycosyl hydrolase [Ignisphaera sp.]